MAATGLQALYTLINSKNGTSYSEATVEVGVPAVNSDNQASVSNTTVLLTALPASGRVGTARVYYGRVDIATATTANPLELAWEGETRVVDLLPKINAALKINLVSGDVNDSELTEGEDGVLSFSVVISAVSIGWTGTLPVRLEVPPVELQSDITEPQLGDMGLNALQDP